MAQLKRVLWLAACGAALLLFPLTAAAQSGTVTDDAFASSNSTTQLLNLNGQGISLIVAGSGAEVGPLHVGSTTTYIKFQIQSSLPSNIAAANVAKATLKLYISPGITPSGDINIFPVTSSWSESTLGPSSVPTLASSPFASTIPVGKANSFLVVDVTQLVQDWLNGTVTNDGIAIEAATSSTYVVFDSKEDIVTSHEPRLEIVLADSGTQGPAGPAGPQGPQGPTGPAGSQGPVGMTGPTGATGATGAQGSQGAAGPQGQQGIAGPIGPAGSPGPVGINNRGLWSASNSYNVNDAVNDGSSYWLAVAPTSANTASPNTSCEPSLAACSADWQLVAAGIDNRGQWSGSNSYNVNDAVADGGAYWLAIAPTSANSASPSTSCEPSQPGCNADWLLLAAQGATGATGLQGPQGLQGIPGPAGQSVTSVALSAGDANCPFGGTEFVSVSGTTFACNGGSSAGSSFHTISGTLSGLLPSTSVTISDNATDNLTLAANGGFTFGMPLATGAGYAVTASTQPTGSTCNVANATGTVGSSNVTNISVTCTSPNSLVTLASGQTSPSAIVVDATNVYWANLSPTFANNGLLKVPIGGGTPTLLSGPTAAIAIAQDQNNLYFTNSNSINQIAKSGGNPTTLTTSVLVPESATTLLPFFGLAVDAQNVYYTSTSTGTGSTLGDVNRISFVGGAASAVTPSIPGTLPQAVVVDATNVYWTFVCLTSAPGPCNVGGVASVFGGVASAPRLGGGPVTLIAGGQTYPAGVAVDSSYVYWTDNAAGTVMKAPIGGGSPITIASGQNYPFGIAIDSTNVYWTNNGGTVMKAPLAGGTPTTIASGQGFPLGIAIDATSVYWTNNTGGTVMKQTPK